MPVFTFGGIGNSFSSLNSLKNIKNPMNKSLNTKIFWFLMFDIFIKINNLNIYLIKLSTFFKRSNCKHHFRCKYFIFSFFLLFRGIIFFQRKRLNGRAPECKILIVAENVVSLNFFILWYLITLDGQCL